MVSEQHFIDVAALDDVRWAELGVPAGPPRFFVQLADELLDSNTQEELRPRLTNVHVLALELADWAARAMSQERFTWEVLAVRAELVRASKREGSFDMDNVVPRRLWKALQDAKKAGALPRTQQLALRIASAWHQGGLQVLRRSLIRSATATTVACPKHQVAGLLETWIAELRHQGHSYEFLRRELHSTLRADASWDVRVQSFIESLPREVARFSIGFQVFGVPSAKEIGSDEVRLLRPNRHMTDEQRELSTALGLGKTDRMAIVKVQGRDVDAMVGAARDLLDDDLAVAQLALADRAVTIAPRTALLDSSGAARVIEAQHEEAFSHRPARRDATGWYAEVIAVLARLRDDDADRLRTAFRQHRRACESRAHGNRLVHLWIALEAIFRTDHSATIEAVAGAVSELIAGALPRRILLRTTILLASKSSNEEKSRLAEAVPSSRLRGDQKRMRLRLEPAELGKLLSAPEDHPRINGLYEAITSNELLCHHVSQARRAFKSPKALAERVVRHQVTIDHQVRRIYRSRNRLVHGGHRSPFLPDLIRHAQHYLASTVMQLTFDLNLSDAGTHIHDLVNRRRLGFHLMLDHLRSGSEDDPPSYEMLTSSAHDHAGGGTRIWGAFDRPQ